MVFWDIMLKKGKIAEGTNVEASNGAMKFALASSVDGIGYVSPGYIRPSRLPLWTAWSPPHTGAC